MYWNLDEAVSWTGNGICLLGQLAQAKRTYQSQQCTDISYLSLFLSLAGNTLFFLYGLGQASPSMIYGMGACALVCVFQLYQKHKFDSKNVQDMYIKLESEAPVHLPDAMMPEFIVRSRANSVLSSADSPRQSTLSPRTDNLARLPSELTAILEEQEAHSFGSI